MPLDGEYEPSPEKWVRDQVERYEATGGREANTLPGRSEPVVVFSTRGARSGKVRKNPLMRVEHDGVYAMVASKGGARAQCDDCRYCSRSRSSARSACGLGMSSSAIIDSTAQPTMYHEIPVED